LRTVCPAATASFRRDVADIMAGIAPAPLLIPGAKPAAQAGPPGPRATLRRGATGELVKIVQRACGLERDGVFTGQTEAAVRELQRKQGLVPDGIIGPKTRASIRES
jgi:peptidoglycan hydrolase-like protein with peptidoglycan-binding domain